MVNWEPVPHHLAYRATREHLTGLLESDPSLAELPVPSCPGWSLRDVVTHLANACLRLQATGPEPGRGQPGAGLPALLASWERSAAPVEQLMAEGRQPQSGVLVMEALTYELDVRQALGIGPPAEHPGYPIALDVVVAGFGRAVRERRLPALWLGAEGRSWVAGRGRPKGAITASRYDLFRSLTGRRSHDRIRALTWSGDPTLWLPLMRWGPFIPEQSPVDPPSAVGLTA